MGNQIQAYPTLGRLGRPMDTNYDITPNMIKDLEERFRIRLVAEPDTVELSSKVAPKATSFLEKSGIILLN